ncbi:unnamed protein product, partial [Rotaria sordida]
MLLSYFILICLYQSLFAIDLCIYRAFTEVRESVNGVGPYKYQFTNADYGNVIVGSISWDGTPFTRLEIYNTIQSLQDAKVIVRRTTKCSCENIEAKIVDPSSMLLQNLKTGAYFYADKESIEYILVRPSEGTTTVSIQFQTDKTKRKGILSYLTRGITWAPSYDLLLTDNNDCKLRAYANIKNTQQKEYTVDMTQLLGGDVPLATDYRYPIRGPYGAQDGKSAMDTSQIEANGEQKGVYSYILKDKYTLRPSSSIRLSFIDIAVKCHFYYKAYTGINTGMYEGTFTRTYAVTPDNFMPAGIITIRDNQLLVGQTMLPDVPKDYTQIFTVGQDNDVRYMVKGTLTSKTDVKAPIQLETYEIDVLIKNFKKKPIDAQLVLQSGIQITLLDTKCKDVNVQGNQLYLQVQLEQGGSRQCTFTVR